MRRLVDDGWSPAEAADAVRSGTAPAVLDEVVGREAPTVSANPTRSPTWNGSCPRLRRWTLRESRRALMEVLRSDRSSTWSTRGCSPPSRHSARGGRAARSTSRESMRPATRSIADSRPRSTRPAAGPEVQRSGRAALGQPARPRRPGVGHRDPQERHGRSLRRCQRAGEQLGGGGAQPRGPSSGDVVVTPEDRPAAVAVAERLLSQAPVPMVCVGGASAANLAGGVQTQASSIGAAAQELDELVQATGY